jgi:ferredoxin-NADP reductase/nitrite reductase/ring-hydroxylating ferredoxin subunit
MSGFQSVANKKDLKEGGLLRVDVGGIPVVLSMVKGKVYAMDAVCSHEGGPLEEGTVDGYCLTCPWHQAIFDVRNARVSPNTNWATDLRSFAASVDEITGDISVSLQPVPGEAAVESKTEPGQQPAATLTLVKKEKLEGTDIMTFRFSKKDYPNYKPGQFAFFPLDNVKDAKGSVRHFSLASSPTEDELVISTRIRDTPYKQALSLLAPGSQIKVSEARGNFTLQEDRPAVLLSGGIGVTPFRSMIKYATDRRLHTRIVMCDSNRNAQNILYKNEFDRWARENKNLKIVYTITDQEASGSVWPGEQGRIGRDMLNRHLADSDFQTAIFYICGPPAMLEAMRNLLQNELQIPRERIRIEEFTGY